MSKRARGVVVCGLLSFALAGGCVVRSPAASAEDAGGGLLLGRDANLPPRPDGGLFFSEDSGIGLGNRLGPAVSATVPPPAISGGTLLASPTDALAFVSDPEDDRVLVVDTAGRALLGSLALTAHDEPGRLVLGPPGRLHVVLRRSGAIATLDVSTPSAPALLERRSVCPAPRGVAYDPTRAELYVACAGGELVVLPSTGAALRSFTLPDDLRDVVVDGARLLVTRFRAAQVLVVDPDTGAVGETITMPESVSPTMTPLTPGVAWRALSRPSGGALLLHQRSSTATIDPAMPGAYGGRGCDDAIVQTALALVAAGTSVEPMPSLPCTPVSVDVALSPDGSTVAVASAGSYPLLLEQVHVYALDATSNTVSEASVGRFAEGRAVAVAIDASGAILVQTRAPAAVHVMVDGLDFTVSLGGTDHADTGLDVFHSEVGGGIACASCHPEGGDDGRVWQFATGSSRTIPLRGGISGTAPFHWRGEFGGMADLLTDVFGSRMSGGFLLPEYESALLAWLDAVPELPARTGTDAAAVARGQTLFESSGVGCTTCHSGPLGSNELTMNVGTGGTFQVPSLRGVAYRAPYLHDGRAATLTDRFGPSGGGDAHGHTSALSAAQIADLVAYLETL